MALQKWSITALLLITAVPAGCLPIMTVSSVAEEARAAEGKVLGRHPDAGKNAWIFVAISTLIAGVLNIAFFMLRRRVKRLNPSDARMGLSRSSWLYLLCFGYAAGFAMGAVIFYDVNVRG